MGPKTRDYYGNELIISNTVRVIAGRYVGLQGRVLSIAGDDVTCEVWMNVREHGEIRLRPVNVTVQAWNLLKL